VQAATNAAQPAERGEGRHRNPRLAGVEEVGARVLRVRLQRPNTNFPSLVAHPVFRPVKVTAENENAKVSAPNLVSNGAFFLARRENESVLLERADNYWGKGDVSLEKVAFIHTPDAEAALTAYQIGEVDAVTNAPFEPLALKLLAPYADYRRNSYAALTYYSFNIAHQPFNDVRVREALAVAIDRDRIIEDELGGASEPANTFLPVTDADKKEGVVSQSASLSKDQTKAKQLLAEAGFPEGAGFPVIKLLINRNEQQRQVAQAVANTWRTVLGIETEIITKPWDEYEAAMRAGEYDLVRRGSVMQTADETTNIRMLFSMEGKPLPVTTAPGPPTPNSGAELRSVPIENETEALRQLTAIPIYFASSYSLVKPYVKGFDSNILDAPSLRTVKIDTSFQTK
jgi:oligopeptide transport system substrate-binding protein